MKRLNHLSVFRISLFLGLSLYIKNIYICILILLFLIYIDYKEMIIYLILFLLCLLIGNIQIDFIKYGVVERKINNYFVIDKILYKTKTYDEVEIGNIVYTDEYTINDNNYLSKNIIYTNNDVNIISNISIKSFINKRINSNDELVSSSLNRILNNIYEYENSILDLGYGFVFYYFLSFISKKKSNISLLLIFLYSLIFYYDIKFYLIIINYLLCKFNLTIVDKFSIKLSIICLYNYNLLMNYSILIPLLFNLYSIIEFKFDFRTYLIFIESYLFGNINLIYLLFYKIMIYIYIFIFTISVTVLFIPGFVNIYRKIILIYSKLNSIHIDIRGSLSIFGIILYYLLVKILHKFDSKYKSALLIGIIISPLNNPLFHVNYIDVGQGDAILISTQFHRKNILIDTGSKYSYYKLSKSLNKEGIYSLDYLIITHNDEDHNGNIDNLINDYKINEIIYEGRNIKDKDILFKNLYTGLYDNDNDSSLVYWMKINGISFLFTGDISNEVERNIIKNFDLGKINVLKLSHHGSASGNSEYFISRILPDIGIISTSGMYNHPSIKTIETLNRYYVDIYNTKYDGNITIYITNLINLLKTQNGRFVIIRV